MQKKKIFLIDEEWGRKWKAMTCDGKYKDELCLIVGAVTNIRIIVNIRMWMGVEVSEVVLKPAKPFKSQW